ncbi:hypothetical protein T265_08603 [Opisthorchis viverrini]|uniref:Uncharacterized protein n=1 Tax=Opisthorchis viverrini TaxID=6198 RepID=A0A074Z8Q9_OPIVI|nr:hypothetical protein T265_08603 [Opisthorchis viverrini]KER23518.1 hypothetical protein T265_08603 [Opisthorchis viverrini]
MARECSSAPYFCFFSFHTVTARTSETMLTTITVARRSRTAIRSGLMNDVEHLPHSSHVNPTSLSCVLVGTGAEAPDDS